MEQAFLVGAQEVRLDSFTELGPHFPQDLKGDLFIAFFGETNAISMKKWLEQKENLSLIGGNPQIFVQDFENLGQYEQEVNRLRTPEA